MSAWLRCIEFVRSSRHMWMAGNNSNQRSVSTIGFDYSVQGSRERVVKFSSKRLYCFN